MTREQVNIAFFAKTKVLYQPRSDEQATEYEYIDEIKYRRYANGRIEVRAVLVSCNCGRGCLVEVPLNYLYPHPDAPLDEPDYDIIPQLECDERVKELFLTRRPVIAQVNARNLPKEYQQNHLGCVIDADRQITLRFRNIVELCMYVSPDGELQTFCGFDCGVEIPADDVSEMIKEANNEQ